MMRRLPPSNVSLLLETPSSEKTLARSKIIIDGRDTGRVVNGEILEAAVQWANHHLLFITDNTPFEEYLRIYLLDDQWRTVDCAVLGTMYSTGVFSDLELVPPNTLYFRFFGGITWTLELLNHNVMSLPFSDPRGVSRPFSFRKRFRIYGEPLPNLEA